MLCPQIFGLEAPTVRASRTFEQAALMYTFVIPEPVYTHFRALNTQASSQGDNLATNSG